MAYFSKQNILYNSTVSNFINKSTFFKYSCYKKRFFLKNSLNDSSRTQKTVSLNQRNISLICAQWKIFIELKKVLLMQKNYLQWKQIYSFGTKKFFLN